MICSPRMILEVRHLRMIEAIANEGGVSRAARRLHLTQPAISHALRDLEKKLGVRLFRRESRRMIPTPEGVRVLRSAGLVLDELQRTERDLSEHKAGRLGVLRLSTHCYTCYHWLPRVLKSFQRDFPGVEVQIIPEATRRPIEALLADELDVAIVSTLPEEENVEVESLFADQMVAVVDPSHPLSGRRFLVAEDFADEHLVIHSDPDTAVVFRELLGPAGVNPRRVSALQMTEAVVETVKAGLGISVLATWVAQPELAAGTLRSVPLTENGLHRTWYAAMQRGRSTAPHLVGLVYLLKCCGFPR